MLMWCEKKTKAQGRLTEKRGLVLCVAWKSKTSAWQRNVQSSVAVCPVRRQCPRFRAPGCTKGCRAGYDQGPRGYPVSEVGPMVRSVTLLTVIVTLSLGRPHSSYKDARPEALVGTKSLHSQALLAETDAQWKEWMYERFDCGKCNEQGQQPASDEVKFNKKEEK